MCGRFGFFAPREVAEARFDVAIDAAGFEPRYNIAPGQRILTIVSDRAAGRKARWQRWGLARGRVGAEERRPPLINARLETAAVKRTFRDSFRRSRCLIPASGYYEWEGETAPDPDHFELRPPPSHRPHWIEPADRAPFALAGIAVAWGFSAEGSDLWRCAILTLPAAGPVRRLHDRMPAVVPRGSEAAWVDPDLQDPDRIRALIETPSTLGWKLHVVSSRVNSPRNEGPELIAPN